ncbi:exosortase/archaeosortase family protein [Dysgonomonas sp. 520]|uniref:exosortase/archaeosortase family protein n=1 Tax=Dysgonomonas sp. 520 TaxID=2302931 RepID=UPI0013D47F90|nr:exosortase/archaeosortase family protein [Dysgonomonas sp. 520]NDW10659.1 exosortase/archaeosortase family protein [Dysgonomonas sp. 520]
MRLNIKAHIQNILKAIAPIKDILWFLFLFLLLNFLWKLVVDDSAKRLLIVLGKDLTWYVHPVCEWTAGATYWVIHDLLGYHEYVKAGTFLYFPDSLKLVIVWDCTSIKQVIIFTILFACYYGPWKKKLIFIPVALLIINVINILRIVSIALIVKDGFPEWFINFNEWYNNKIWINDQISKMEFERDWFQLFHRDIFTWIYYDGIIFLLWLYWQEKINLPYQRLKARTRDQAAVNS